MLHSWRRLHVACLARQVACLRPVYRNLSISSAEEGKQYPKSSVYTRTGDKGTSMLFNMTRVSKEADYFEVLGAVDEASSMIGIAREHCRAANNNLDEYLEKIQCCLLDVGSQAATPRNSSDLAHLERTTFAAGHVADLEHWTDKLDSTLPPLRNFILASGGLSATSLHAARAVTRRAERRMVPLANRGDVDDTVLKYLNRLSDFLFIAARFAAKHEGREELVYKKRSPGDHKRSLS